MASDPATDIAGHIAALQALGAQQREPLRYHFITALARRSVAQGGALRKLLDARLAAALADLQQRLHADLQQRLHADAAGPGTATPGSGTAPGPEPGPLATLLHQAGACMPPGVNRSALKAVQQFASTWAGLRVDQQLQRAQAQQPQHAGPLNSQRLVLQALQQLRGLSPAYLQHFMAHAEALLWLDDARTGLPATPPVRSAAGDAGGRRRRSARRKTP
jgi:hypothetical protein